MGVHHLKLNKIIATNRHNDWAQYIHRNYSTSKYTYPSIATNGERTISFRAAIPVQQGAETEAGIPVVRKSPSEPFEHEVDLDEEGLWIAFDAAPWLAQVDFGSMVAPPVSQTNPNPVFVIEPGTQPYRALRNAVLSGERPAFRWSSPR